MTRLVADEHFKRLLRLLSLLTARFAGQFKERLDGITDLLRRPLWWKCSHFAHIHGHPE